MVSPAVVVGGLIVLATWYWARWHVTARDGAVELVATGPLGEWFRARNWAAVTVGIWIACWRAPDERIRVHERRHCAQWLTSGVFFGVTYLLCLLRFGYADLPWEVDATAHEP